MVWVGVLADVVEVVVLAAGADTLLGVGSALEGGHAVGLVDGAEEDGLELVHAGIGEEEGGVIVRDDGGGRHYRVAPFGKVVEKGLADRVRGPLALVHDGQW